jgi:HEXXH motif-containing protein
VSPFCTIDAETDLPPLRAHTVRELAIIARRVRDATGRIAGVRSGILETIFQVTRVIVCRKTTTPKAGFASSSWPAYVGKVALVNAHCAELTAERLANALIHEAIHSILFMIETSEPFVVDFTRDGDATVTSPWSGRALPLINYVHACFVWYGLWCFWRLAARAKAFAPASAASHLELAASGFRGPPLLTALAPLRSCVASAALDSIREAQETVVDN